MLMMNLRYVFADIQTYKIFEPSNTCLLECSMHLSVYRQSATFYKVSTRYRYAN